jgi:hypothetical protein
MQLTFELYKDQLQRWSKSGCHILAQYNHEHIVVYQAYSSSIGHFAAQHGYFGGDDFKFNRMSWIKPNFLWMMFRSGWGAKSGQAVVLAIWRKHSAFEAILTEAVHSTYVPDIYGTEKEWKAALSRSSVRLQWDPDHNPSGNSIEWRAIQLGLRGDILKEYAQGGWITHTEDISGFVKEQFEHVKVRDYEQLLTPKEKIYMIADAEVARRLGLTGRSDASPLQE